MFFELCMTINRSPADVFAFFRDKDQFPQKPDSRVLHLDKTTPGPISVGTCYREVIQILPFVHGDVFSRITRFEPDDFLEEDFEGAGMRGHLAYQFIQQGEGTLLIQRETIEWRGIFKLCVPVIKPVLGQRLRQRLADIKTVLDGGWIVQSSAVKSSDKTACIL